MNNLAKKIVAYLTVNSIGFELIDFSTGYIDGEEEKIVRWDNDKLGKIPDEGELNSALDIYVYNEASLDVRHKRDNLLKESDWTMLSDVPVDSSLWGVYREQLRKVPTQSGFPFAVVWPLKPE